MIKLTFDLKRLGKTTFIIKILKNNEISFPPFTFT